MEPRPSRKPCLKAPWYSCPPGNTQTPRPSYQQSTCNISQSMIDQRIPYSSCKHLPSSYDATFHHRRIHSLYAAFPDLVCAIKTPVKSFVTIQRSDNYCSRIRLYLISFSQSPSYLEPSGQEKIPLPCRLFSFQSPKYLSE